MRSVKLEPTFPLDLRWKSLGVETFSRAWSWENKGWDILVPTKIRARSPKQVWDGGMQAHLCTYGWEYKIMCRGMSKMRRFDYVHMTFGVSYREVMHTLLRSS